MNMVTEGSIAQPCCCGDAGISCASVGVRAGPDDLMRLWPGHLTATVRRLSVGALALVGFPVGAWSTLEAPRNLCAVFVLVWTRRGPREAWRTLIQSVQAVASGGCRVAPAPYGGLAGYPGELRLSPPPNRGRLLSAAQVAELFPGRVTERWVRDHVSCSIQVGRKRMWFEEDVWSFLRSLRDQS